MQDESFIEQYAATGGFRHGLPTGVEVAGDGSAIYFLRSPARSPVRSLHVFDTTSGEERELLAAERLLSGSAESMSEHEQARRERLRLSARGITAFELAKDGRFLLVPLGGRIFVFDVAADTVRELARAEAPAEDPRFSPDASQIAFVREDDLHVVTVATDRVRRLTHTAGPALQNGLAEFVAQEEMRRFRGYFWAPDGSSLLYQETRTDGVETLYIQDPIHPESPPRTAAYPRAGRDNAVVRLGHVAASGGPTRWLDWDRDRYPYLVTVRWEEGQPPLLVVEDRHQSESLVLEVDLARSPTGSAGLGTRVLHRETDERWINIDPSVPRPLGAGGGFLWMTERNGAPQLIRVSTADTAPGSSTDDGRAADPTVRTLTTPTAGYAGLVHVDAAAGTCVFEGGDAPTETHLYRVSLDGGRPRPLTDGSGVQTGYFAEGTDVWVEERHSLDQGPSFVVRRGDETIGELGAVAETPSLVPQVELVETTADGVEGPLAAAIVRPSDFQAGRRYPVLLMVYGGPHHQMVRAAQSRFLLHQFFANQGFVVVSMDGRGTPGRGSAFERAISGNFIALPLADQASGLRDLAARHAELDLERVGVYGWSFGGYFSAMAVLQQPDLFRAAVAGAPVVDWTDYDTHYTERYLGLPDENPEGYRASSVLTYADQLRRPLLLIHGTADDNVYFTHSLKLAEALFHARREFELLPLTGTTHMVADPDAMKSLYARIVSFFHRNL